MPSRPSIARTVVCLSAAGVVLSTFLPWLQSGKRRRSSYELIGVATRLQQVPTGSVRIATLVWPAVPLLVVAAVLAVLWGRHRLGAVFGVVGALYVAGFAVVFWNLDIPPLGGVQIGSTVAVAVAASVAFVGSLAINARTSSVTQQPPFPSASRGDDRRRV